jgi:hypothetical protein
MSVPSVVITIFRCFEAILIDGGRPGPDMYCALNAWLRLARPRIFRCGGQYGDNAFSLGLAGLDVGMTAQPNAYQSDFHRDQEGLPAGSTRTYRLTTPREQSAEGEAHQSSKLSSLGT